MRADVAAEREDCAEVHLEHGVPVNVGELVRGVPALDAAAVDEDVDARHGGKDAGGEGGD